MAQPFEFIDLSVLTSFLVDAIDHEVQNSPVWDPVLNPKPTVVVSASSPDSVRKASDAQLTFYLFHVDSDPHHRNAPVDGGKRAQPIPFQPQALNLYYMLTAFAGEKALLEQQIFSIALRFLYEHPIFHTAAGRNQFTLTMQPESADELGRLWQSMTVAARLSTVYRVAVVFMTAPAPAAAAKPVQTYTVVADPAALPFATDGEVLGTERRVTYRAPQATDPVSFIRSPATAAPGQRLHLWGSHLGITPSDRVYLLSADSSMENDVSSWIVAAVDNLPDGTAGGARLTLALPATVGTPPANAPSPGIYQLRVGSDGPPRFRSNATPFSVAPGVTAPTTTQVVLTPVAGVFTLAGAGFDNAVTDVLLGTVPLTRRNPGDTLVDGDFHAVSASSIQFRAPQLPAGDYPVRVRVNNVEADPAWWVHV